MNEKLNFDPAELCPHHDDPFYNMIDNVQDLLNNIDEVCKLIFALHKKHGTYTLSELKEKLELKYK